MNGHANALMWTGKWLLQIPIYLVTSYVIRTLIGGVYASLVRAGANLPPNFLLSHMLWVSIIDGFLAGLIGLSVVRALFLLRRRVVPATNSPWTLPQAWTWLLPTCWLAFGVLGWLTDHAHHSVLASSSDMKVSYVVAAFFGSGCYLGGGDFSAETLRGCVTQMSFTHPWLGTIGYSAATFVSPKYLNRLRGSITSAESASEQNHSESTAQ